MTFTLADEEQASVPSQKYNGEIVQLFWSSRREAERWAKALTGENNLQEISLTEFAVDILPGLIAAKGLVGTDWISDPIEAEIDPTDLLHRLKQVALANWLQNIADDGTIYLLSNDDGPAFLTELRRSKEVTVMPVYASREEAKFNLEHVGGLKITSDPLQDFLDSTLPWAIKKGHRLAIEPIPGAGPVDLAADELAARLPGGDADKPRRD